MAGPDRRRPESALHARVELVQRDASPRPLAGARLAVSPRLGIAELDTDVAAGFDLALETCRRLGAELVEPPPPGVPAGVGDDFVAVLTTEMLVYHRRFDDRRGLYRPSIREWVEEGERRAVSGEAYVAAQERRREVTGVWGAWLAEHRLDALVEPTIPVVAPLRGDGYDHAGTDYALISLTHLWDWTGFPVAALPDGCRAQRLADRRVADRTGRSRLGPALPRRRAPGRAGVLIRPIGLRLTPGRSARAGQGWKLSSGATTTSSSSGSSRPASLEPPRRRPEAGRRARTRSAPGTRARPRGPPRRRRSPARERCRRAAR